MLKHFNNDLKRLIKKSNTIYIVGHNYIDLDAFGASLGISLIASKFKKKSFIIIDDNILEKSVDKAYFSVKDRFSFIKSNTIDEKDYLNSLLIIVDTNKDYLVSVDYKKFSYVVIIDHHDMDKNTISSNLKMIDTKKSSTCEIISYLLQINKIRFSNTVSNIILSGIVLDTNNFILKSSCDTFKTATFLLSNGASTTSVQYLLKQDIKKFMNRQKMLANILFLKDNIAVVRGVKNEFYRREDLAKNAETLLLFEKVETSFVIGNLNETEVGISGRTLGNLNIGKIMKKLGGGGNKCEGAASLKNIEIKDVLDKLKDIL